MRSATAHIDPNPSTYTFAFGLVLIAFFLGIFKRIRKIHWRTGAIKSINKSLSKIYFVSEGLLSVSEAYDRKKALEEHESAKKLLSKYRSFYALLEKVEFFSLKETENLSENTLSNLYKLESRLRHLAFEESDINPDDKALADFASHLSLSSLRS